MDAYSELLNIYRKIFVNNETIYNAIEEELITKDIFFIDKDMDLDGVEVIPVFDEENMKWREIGIKSK